MNITFIGMPGAGKSYYGKLLAQALNYAFIDIDTLIEAEGMKISELIAQKGTQALMDREEEKACALHTITNTIIAPGGSIIYSEKAMRHLQKISTVIYLEVPLTIIIRRVKQRDEGNENHIIGVREKGWETLYAERTQLYKKYAHITIQQSENTKSTEILLEIQKQVQR